MCRRPLLYAVDTHVLTYVSQPVTEVCHNLSVEHGMAATSSHMHASTVACMAEELADTTRQGQSDYSVLLSAVRAPGA